MSKIIPKCWHRYEVKIQKDTKRYDLRTYAVLWYFKRTYTQQKSGTALLPFHSSRLWYCLCIKTATPKPTPYVYILIGTRLCAYVYIHTIGILVSQCFVTFNEIYQISECQNKARKTLSIMSCIPPHFWTPPRRGLQKNVYPTLCDYRIRRKITIKK